MQKEEQERNSMQRSSNCLVSNGGGSNEASVTVGALSPDPFFGNVAEVPARLDLVDAAMLGLAIDNALRHALLPASTLHTHTVDEVALLRLVAELACLVCPRRSRSSVDGW